MKHTTVAISEITYLVRKGWRRVLTKSEADEVAEAVVTTALQKDARIDPIGETLEDLRLAFRKGFKIRCLSKSRAVESYDLCGRPGIMFMPRLTKRVVHLAKQFGIGIVAMKNSSSVETLSSWLLKIPSFDCIGVFCWNGGSYTTVPFGSLEPFFGTNPLAYAIPTQSDPIVADMATSDVTFMDLMIAMNKHGKLPPNSGLDDRGHVTRDPHRIYDVKSDSDVRLLPIGGGHKGSAIMLFLEIVTGALVNAKMSREATSSHSVPAEFGGVLVAIDLSALTNPTLFKKRVTRMLAQIRRSKSTPRVKAVRVPGDASLSREAAARQSGVLHLSTQVVADLCALIEGECSSFPRPSQRKAKI